MPKNVDRAKFVRVSTFSLEDILRILSVFCGGSIQSIFGACKKSREMWNIKSLNFCFCESLWCVERSSEQFVDGLSNRANFRKDFCKKTRNIIQSWNNFPLTRLSYSFRIQLTKKTIPVSTNMLSIKRYQQDKVNSQTIKLALIPSRQVCKHICNQQIDRWNR